MIFKKFVYKNYIKWKSEKRGILSSSGKPDIEVAPPPEFGGYPGVWSPEDLLVASANSCIMTTFLYYCRKLGIELLGYESEAEGILERTKKTSFAFSKIKVRQKIRTKNGSDIEKIKEAVALSEKDCFISNSISAKTVIIPEIIEAET